MQGNGALVTCQGITDGELIIYSHSYGDSPFILFLMLASKPDLDIICSIFCDLIESRFPQYIH